MGKASKAKRRARELRNQEPLMQQALVDRVQQSLPHERIKVVKRQGGRKVSEVLMKFAEPWLEEARNDDERKTVIGMAVLAWNMAAIPEPERWDGVSQEFAEKLTEPAKAILQEMIARKLSVYPEEDRPLLGYEITGAGAHMRVDVLYSLLPEEVARLKQSDPGLADR
jgi:hypothetical protein